MRPAVLAAAMSVLSELDVQPIEDPREEKPEPKAVRAATFEAKPEPKRIARKVARLGVRKR